MIIMASVVKDGDIFYPQLFLKGELFNKYTQPKALKEKISKKLMPVTWHPTRWLNWCLLRDERKGVEPIFTDKVGKFYKACAKRWEIVKVDGSGKNASTVRP